MVGRDHRLNRRRSKRLDDASSSASRRVVAQLDGQHLGIDRGGVDLARGHHPDRALVKSGLDSRGRRTRAFRRSRASW